MQIPRSSSYRLHASAGSRCALLRGCVHHGVGRKYKRSDGKALGHIGDRAQRVAVEALCEPVSDGRVVQNPLHSSGQEEAARAN